MSKEILYEQPLNELIRVCLRLEYLLQQAKYRIIQTSYFDSRAAMQDIIEITNVLDRPDFRSKITTELLHYRKTIQCLESKASIDRVKLGNVLFTLNEDINYLENTYGKFAQNLRTNEFLTNLRYAMSRPGGAWSFDVPLYHHWLEQGIEERQADLQKWFDEFIPIKKIIEHILKLIRDWTQSKEQHAINGFYQIVLDPKLPYQLVQLWLPKKLQLIPEISVSKHRLSIRFLDVSYEKRPQQTDKDLSYKIKIGML